MGEDNITRARGQHYNLTSARVTRGRGQHNKVEDSITRARTTHTAKHSKEGDQRRRFAISDKDYLNAERHAAREGLTLLGVYHSHPLHPAIPSEHDLAVALPYFSYIIVSVQPEGTAHVRSWQLDEQRQFAEEAIVALPEAWRIS